MDTAADWPALRKWDFDFFAQSCGHIEVEVALQGGRKRRNLLKDYLALLRRDTFRRPFALPYLRGWYYERDAPWLSDDLWRHGDFHDVAFQDHFRKLPERHHPDFHWLFIGGEGSTTPLHVDPSETHAWLTQIRGRKRFTLFPPFEMASLLKPDGGFKPLKQILQERSALPLQVILNPGDTLFVPAHWPHEVECLDDSISVTWNFLGQSIFPIIRAAFLANATRSREPAEG
ncbi:jmjd6-a [Symbiodinium sp. CCMP2592]|nr:jmjd6-a [Symbiodinium sp. CCMP2592]